MPEISVSINASAATRGARQFKKATNNVSNSAANMDKNVSKSKDGFLDMSKGIMAVAAPYAAAATAMGLFLTNATKITDKYITLTSQLTSSTGSAESASDAMDMLFKISQSTATAVDVNAASFNRLRNVVDKNKQSDKDLIGLVERLNILMKATGVNGGEAEAAMTQLSQALGSGILAGDEFKSISENFPALMKEIAEELDVPIGALKKMASEGKITSDVVIRSMEEIREEVGTTLPKTAEAGWTRVINSYERGAAAMGMGTGLSQVLYDGFTMLSTAIDDMVSNVERAIAIYDVLASKIQSATNTDIGSVAQSAAKTTAKSLVPGGGIIQAAWNGASAIVDKVTGDSAGGTSITNNFNTNISKSDAVDIVATQKREASRI